jgi:hypothetical protein
VSLKSTGFKIIHLDCVIAGGGIAIELPISGLARLTILKPLSKEDQQ